MKKQSFMAFALAYVLILGGCSPISHATEETFSDFTENIDQQEILGDIQKLTSVPDRESERKEPMEDLPTALAKMEDMDGSGGYLLIGEIVAADIALYCDNSEDRDMAYIRYGEHFQAFQQKAWIDPTVLPELDWQDWDDDGAMELVVKYLRHEGTYFDGQSASPGLVCEMVVYKWDENQNQWSDIHFYSSGGLQEYAP